MTEWIKCSERMPPIEDYERKIIFSRGDGICTARYNSSYWDLDPAGDFSTGGYIFDVTHWAQLPKPPIMDEKVRNYG